MKALPSIAFNEFKGSLSSFYAFTIKDTNTFLETVKFCDCSTLNVPPISLSNVPGISELNVPSVSL